MVSKIQEYGFAQQPKDEILDLKQQIKLMKSSNQFLLGAIVSKSLKKPWLWPLLPFRIIYSSLKSRNNLNLVQIEEEKDHFRDCTVLFTTHAPKTMMYERTYSIAKKLKEMDESHEVVFLTIHSNEINYEEGGFSSYRIPHKQEMMCVSVPIWNSMIEEMISLIFRVHRPKCFIFDGLFPFRGMLNAISAESKITRIWLSTNLLPRAGNEIPIASINMFDILIKPLTHKFSEIEDHDALDVDFILCDPIHNKESGGLNKRKITRNELGLNQDELLVYIGLKEGECDDPESHIGLCLKILSEMENLQIITDRKIPDAPSIMNGIKVHEINTINSEGYFAAIDIAIITGDEVNIQHCIRNKVPSLCLPRPKGGSMHQFERTSSLGKNRCVIVLPRPFEEQIRIVIKRLFEENVRKELINKLNSIQQPNGAFQIARWIVDLNQENI